MHSQSAPVHIFSFADIYGYPNPVTTPACRPRPHPPSYMFIYITDQDIYKVVSSLTESLKDEIQAMVNIAIKQEVKPLLTKISELKSRIHYLESEMDASNQYSRRNCVLISRPNIDEHTGEDTNTIAIKVAKEGGLTIKPSDIDRSHRMDSSTTVNQDEL